MYYPCGSDFSSRVLEIRDGFVDCRSSDGPASYNQWEEFVCMNCDTGFLYHSSTDEGTCLGKTTTSEIKPDTSCTDGFRDCYYEDAGVGGVGGGDGGVCSSCTARNLQCPQYALVGSPFNISVEFQRGDSDYEGRSVWGPVYYPESPEQCFWFWFFGWVWVCQPAQPAYIDYEELWCKENDPTSECSWYSGAPSVNCPTQPGTYTYDIGCAGYEEGDYYCGQTNQPSTKASCDVQCVTTLPTYLLTVTKQGTGSGAVTSNPAGVNCGSDCQETYSDGTQVTLTASPSAGSVFAGWSGACSGAFSSCTLTVDNNKTVTATFQATSIGHVRIQGTSGLIKLNLISVADAIAALKGVIKIALPGGTIGAADLVETSNPAASPVRVRTPQGTKAWRKID